MKAIVLNGIKEKLVVEEVDKPIPAAGEVVVKIKAAAFNHRDWWIQQGQYAGLRFPIILGSDGSGIVDSVGPEVSPAIIGRQVVIYNGLGWGNDERFPADGYQNLGLPDNGTWAEYVKIPAENIFPKPSHLTFEEAAALPVAGVTAWRALFVRGHWQPGDKVLISGAGGGAAVFALQFAVAAGAEVYVTSSSEEKIQKAVRLGATGGVNYHDTDWAAKLQLLAGNFDVIIDSALGNGFADLVNLAAKGATIAFFGATAGQIPELNGRILFSKQLNLCGTSSGSPRDFMAMLDFIAAHQLKPVIDEIFPFEQAEQAMRTMDKGNARYGKVAMTVG